MSEEQQRDIDIVPAVAKNLRACLVCSLVKTEDQFLKHGCDNCDKYYKINEDNIDTCTSSNFFGMIGLMDPGASWVAKWQRIDNRKPGCYALKVTGELPDEVLESFPEALRRRYQRSMEASDM